MTLDGVFQNGQVRFDVPPRIPDGTRVTVEVPVVPPFRVETPEEELAGMREASEDMEAGRVRPWDEMMKEMRNLIRQREVGG